MNEAAENIMAKNIQKNKKYSSLFISCPYHLIFQAHLITAESINISNDKLCMR